MSYRCLWSRQRKHQALSLAFHIQYVSTPLWRTLHFTDEETETPKGDSTCPGSQSRWGPDWKPSLTPEPASLSAQLEGHNFPGNLNHPTTSEIAQSPGPEKIGMAIRHTCYMGIYVCWAAYPGLYKQEPIQLLPEQGEHLLHNY